MILRKQRKKMKKHDEKKQKLRDFDTKSKTRPSCSLTTDRFHNLTSIPPRLSSQRELFSCLQKADHVTAKMPIIGHFKKHHIYHSRKESTSMSLIYVFKEKAENY